jgi:nucleoside-diphosphate-sugar epimerase
VHPGRDDPKKLLGYTGNVAHQILRLLDAPAGAVAGRTFHLADDAPTTLRHWAGRIAAELGVRPPRTAPGPLVSLAARCGDLLAGLGVSGPPLTSVRLANMRRDTSDVPMEPTRAIAGPSPYTLEQGVERTVAWMRRASLIP